MIGSSFEHILFISLFPASYPAGDAVEKERNDPTRNYDGNVKAHNHNGVPHYQGKISYYRSN